MERIKDAIRSEGMKATAHVLTLIVSCLGIPLVLWLFSTTRDLDKQVAVMSVRDEQHGTQIKTLNEAVIALKNIRDGDMIQSSEIKITLGRVLEKLDGQNRILDGQSQTLNRIQAEMNARPTARN